MGRLLDVENLSADLQKLKQNLEATLEHNLNKIENTPGWSWVQKQKMSANLLQAYEDSWLNQLARAGIVVSPVFEDGVARVVKAPSLSEEVEQYENLWN